MAVKPRIKLDRKEAKKGDLVEVKALVSHVMPLPPAASFERLRPHPGRTLWLKSEEDERQSLGTRSAKSRLRS